MELIHTWATPAISYFIINIFYAEIICLLFQNFSNFPDGKAFDGLDNTSHRNQLDVAPVNVLKQH